MSFFENSLYINNLFENNLFENNILMTVLPQSISPLVGQASYSPTISDIAVFVASALLILGGALAVILLRNPVHSALSLVVALAGVAIQFVSQQAHFLAAVQIIVYAGAIVVMFLFVIMLLGVDKSKSLVIETTPKQLSLQKPLAILTGLVIFLLVIGITGKTWEGIYNRNGQFAEGTNSSNVENLADSIFTTYLFPLEATSLLLVIAVVASVALARKNKNADLEVHDLHTSDSEEDLDKSDLDKSDLDKSDLDKSDLDKSDLDKSDLDKSDLDKSDLGKSDLNKSDLNKSDLDKEDLDRNKVLTDGEK